jgi:hypothetical protein
LTTVTIQASTPTAYEQTLAPGVVTITADSFPMQPMQPLSVQYSVSGTAQQGTTVQNLGSSLTLPFGQTSASFNVTPIDDHLGGPDLTVVITLSPSADYTLGSPSSATVTIVEATPAAPSLQLLDGATPLVNGTSNDSFGSVPVGSTASRTFSVQNTGSGTLTLSSLLLPVGFSLAGAFPSSVAPGSTASYTVSLNAAMAGSYSGPMSFADNDSANNPFQITLNGQVTAPAAAVLEGGMTLANGSGADSFGATPVGTSVQKTFSISNTGSDTLALTAGSLSLPAGFSLVGSFPSSVAAGGTASFVVQLDAAAAGSFSGTLSFNDNDPNNNPYRFTLSGQATATVIPYEASHLRIELTLR